MSFRNIEKFHPEIDPDKKENLIDYSQFELADIKITEPVRVKGSAFLGAKNCQAETVETGGSAFFYAENCRVKTVRGFNIFTDAENCQVETAMAKRDAFYGAKNCQAGTVDVGEYSFFEGDAFLSAERSLATKVKAGLIGENSRGVVILEETKGRVFPPVILMKGRVKEKPEEVKQFFQEELKKSQQGEESIFDYLSYFEWEGETLEQGNKILKQRYERIKNKGLLEELKECTFYYLIDDNFKREEILFGFKKLRRVERAILKDLNNHLLKFKEIKQYLSVLSLKDWIKIGEYKEFLDYDKGELKKIKNKFKDIALETILENPEEFKKSEIGAGIAKRIIELRNRGEAIRDKQKLEKELQKEIKNKTNHLIREYLLNNPKKNLENYLKRLGIERELDQDILFAANLHKRIKKGGNEKNKEILEQLMKGTEPLDWLENREWLSKMKNRKWLLKMKDKIDTEAWLRPCLKEYSLSTSIDYQDSLIKSQKEQKEEIIEHLKEIGIEVSLETEIQEIKKILEERRQEIPENIQKDIKTYLDAISSLKGVEKSRLPEKIILEIEKDPLKTLQMGQKVIGSCLRLGGGHEKSVIVNSVDINKQVVWAKDERGRILGRVLIGITEEGKLAGFRIYNNDPRIELESCFKDFLSSLAKELKTELTSEGEIKELVGENWHNDGIVNWEKQESL